MSRVLYAFALIILIHLSLLNRLSACGYNFVGDCSTSIGLRINGTLDSFALAECPFGTVFNGLDLGEIQNLSLAKAKGVTWESCQNNVTNIGLFYRVYQEGQPGGSWQSLDLPQEYFTLVGPYTTRYRSKSANISLTNGLTVGNTYILEVYLRAEIDTIGDDFIPETFLLQNNNGQNFKLKFEFGGAGAPPFSVVTTRQKDVDCHGDSTGVAGVSVYGNQSGLFYHWEGYNNNFPILANIAAGVYTITVTGAGGYSQTQSITVAEPAQIQNQFFNILPVNCGGPDGQVSALASGGVPPFQYQWSTGQQGPVTNVPSVGLWQLTVTDAHFCTAVFSISIPGTPASEENICREICVGDTFLFAGQTYTATGNYDVLINGPGACDTLIHLEVKAFDPGALLAALPSDSAINCAHPSIDLCLENIANTAYTWQNGNGNIIGTGSCLNINTEGPYIVSVNEQGVQLGCSASKSVYVGSSFEEPAMVFNVINASGPQAADGTIIAKASGGSAPYTISWDELGSVGDSVAVVENVLPGNYCFTVTGANGCTDTGCASVSYSSGAVDILQNGGKIFPNPARAGEAVIFFLPAGVAPELQGIEMIDLTGKKTRLEGQELAQGVWRIVIPNSLTAGLAYVHVVGEHLDYGWEIILLSTE